MNTWKLAGYQPGEGALQGAHKPNFDDSGWLPVDVDNGLMKSRNHDINWFFLGGMDSYRIIVNDDYAQHLYPAKIHHRSETLDFQRGEVEWEGGNLYFDQWTYQFNVKIIEQE